MISTFVDRSGVRKSNNTTLQFKSLLGDVWPEKKRFVKIRGSWTQRTVNTTNSLIGAVPNAINVLQACI